MNPTTFRTLVWRYYRAHGRHDLPWRPPSLKLREGKADLYRVLVSEVMLQQTQVERVIPFYAEFMRRFPTARKLAAAPLSEVLHAWQGLGYNRRAKMLREAARSIVAPRDGKLPKNVAGLESLPGVGPYTAHAIAAFAHNADVVVVETNIRTVILHHFFPKKKKVSDKEIEKILTRILPKGKSREWYSALMDYGAFLKNIGISHNARSSTYTKQSKFTGSLREARGAILRELARGPAPGARLIALLGAARRLQIRVALQALRKEGLVKKAGGQYALGD